MVEQFRQEPKGNKIMMTTLGSTRYDFCVKKSDSNAEKPSCAMLELRVEIELTEKLRKQKKVLTIHKRSRKHTRTTKLSEPLCWV